MDAKGQEHKSFPLPDLGEPAFKNCYSAFRKHCMEVHGLRQDSGVDSAIYLNLEKCTLTLLKRSADFRLTSAD